MEPSTKSVIGQIEDFLLEEKKLPFLYVERLFRVCNLLLWLYEYEGTHHLDTFI